MRRRASKRRCRGSIGRAVPAIDDLGTLAVSVGPTFPGRRTKTNADVLMSRTHERSYAAGIKCS